MKSTKLLNTNKSSGYPSCPLAVRKANFIREDVMGTTQAADLGCCPHEDDHYTRKNTLSQKNYIGALLNSGSPGSGGCTAKTKKNGIRFGTNGLFFKIN